MDWLSEIKKYKWKRMDHEKFIGEHLTDERLGAEVLLLSDDIHITFLWRDMEATKKFAPYSRAQLLGKEMNCLPIVRWVALNALLN